MAKSKSGGTRSYLRGRIANDVYSIGKDGKGKKQQVVRSLAETVANPQTVAQMRGRMIMATVMQAVSAMSPIIDHSFDGIATGQPSISEFIRRNYALIKADVAAHPASGNAFGLNKYQEKGIKIGEWLVSSGSAIMPAAVGNPSTMDFGLTLTVPTSANTAGAIRTALGIGDKDYITVCGVTNEGKFVFYRVNVSYALADDTTISAENIAQLLIIDNPQGHKLTFDVISGQLQVLCAQVTPDAVAHIFTQKTADGFIHSTSEMVAPASPDFAADVALPTYPIGEERFLNGGEL